MWSRALGGRPDNRLMPTCAPNVKHTQDCTKVASEPIQVQSGRSGGGSFVKSYCVLGGDSRISKAELLAQFVDSQDSHGVSDKLDYNVFSRALYMNDSRT